MTENDSDSLPFEPPEQENIRLREENARLRRLLAVHSIPIPKLAPENPPSTKAVEPAPPVDKEERARKRIALFRNLFRASVLSVINIYNSGIRDVMGHVHPGERSFS